MNTPSVHLERFELWLAKPLEMLMNDPHSGFAVTIVAFPMLERYLRGKTKAEPQEPAFQAGLIAVLPELGSIDVAKRFWWKYRHSLLHWASFQQSSFGFSDSPELFSRAGEQEMWLNPRLFAIRVLETVRADFATFESGKVPLPSVQRMARDVRGSNGWSPYWGTSALPPRKEE